MRGGTCLLLLTTCSVWLHGGGDCVTSTQSECSGWMLNPERLAPALPGIPHLLCPFIFLAVSYLASFTHFFLFSIQSQKVRVPKLSQKFSLLAPHFPLPKFTHPIVLKSIFHTWQYTIVYFWLLVWIKCHFAVWHLYGIMSCIHLCSIIIW